MCRYAFYRYKPRFACFACRVAFKASDRNDTSERRCPRCARPADRMGLDFEPPRRDDVDQWRKVERLANAGLRFASCGCGGPDVSVGSPEEADAWLEANRRRASVGYALLARLPRRRGTGASRARA